MHFVSHLDVYDNLKTLLSNLISHTFLGEIAKDTWEHKISIIKMFVQRKKHEYEGTWNLYLFCMHSHNCFNSLSVLNEWSFLFCLKKWNRSETAYQNLEGSRKIN